ncbi:MAG: adenine deaminase [Bacillota bacterium]
MKKSLLEQARGDKKAELVLKNGKIVDVYNGEIIEADLAISEGLILGYGDYQGEEEKDLQGAYILPGFIDAHLHLESAMARPDQFCQLVVSRGTLTVVADPHEIANVSGLVGVRYLLEQGQKLPWNFHLMMPSCVPATEAETSGAKLTADDLKEIIDQPGIFGLGEMMDYLGVIEGNDEVWAKLDLAQHLFIDGHAPEVTGKALNAYLLGGIQADHECTTAEEAREKAARGMYIMIREGSVTQDMEALLPAVTDFNNSSFMLATDDRHPEDLLNEGHIDYLIKRAINLGVEPLLAYRLATLNPARALNLKDRGAIAPGKKADLVIINQLEKVDIDQIYKDGKLLVENGNWLNFEQPEIDANLEAQVQDTVKIKPIEKEDFSVPLGKSYRVIELVDQQVITRERVLEKLPGENPGEFLDRLGLNRLAVIERHNATGNIGLGLLEGFNLKQGALASSVAHDSHNVIVVGRSRHDMLTAVNAIEEMGGGQVVVAEGQIKAQLPLPIAGLLSELPLVEVAEKIRELDQAAAKLGVEIKSPFMVLAFLALPVIPDLKLTDKGLYNVKESRHVSLLLES